MSHSLTGKLWRTCLGLVALVLIAVAALLYWNPLWLIQRTLDVYLYKHHVQRRSVPVGQYNIAYLEAKPAGNGPDRPLLLIHGLGARATDWAPVIPELAAHGYHVYAPDLLGYGDSPKPTNGDYTLAGEERIVLGFAQAMGLSRADVGGWSMGGWLAMKVALDRPQLVHRLMLYDSAGLYFQLSFPLDLFAPTNREELERLTRQIEPDKPFIKVPGFAAHGMVYQMQRGQSVVDASFRSMLAGNELLDFRVHNLKMPVLIVWGAEDKLTPMSMGLRLHQLVPQSVFVGIGGCGHLTVAECASQAVPVTLNFLAADPPLPASTTMLPSVR